MTETQQRLAAVRAERLELLSFVHTTVDPIELGYSHREDFAQQCLGISNRAWQEHVRVWERLQSLPIARSALSKGVVSAAKLTTILAHLTLENEAIWLRRAVRLGPGKLRTAIEQAMPPADATTGPQVSGRPDRQRSRQPDDSATTIASADVSSDVSSDASLVTSSSIVPKECAHDSSGGAPITLRIRCPYQSIWSCHSFAETVSRRIGCRARAQDYLDVAAASFLAEVGPEVSGRLQRRVHWPPTFVNASDSRSHNSAPSAPSSDRRTELDTYVYRTDGQDVESPGSWLAFWRKHASDRNVPEPKAGDPGWAFYNGIAENQTDGLSFVMSRPMPTPLGTSSPDAETRPDKPGAEPTLENPDQRARSISQNVLDQLEEIIAGRVRAPGDAGTVENTEDTEGTGDARNTGNTGNTGNTEGNQAQTASDSKAILRQLHNLEAETRVLERHRLECLHHIREDRSFIGMGFPNFDEYAETRVGRTARTVRRWLRQPSASPTLRAAESDPRLRTPALRQLERLERNGTNEPALRLWIARAIASPLKDFRNQVDWALASNNLQSKKASPSEEPLPPEESLWRDIWLKIQADPLAIGSIEFHEQVRDVARKMKSNAETCLGESANDRTCSASGPSKDRTFSASGQTTDETLSAPQLATDGTSRAPADRTFSGPELLSTWTFCAPGPSADRTFSARTSLDPKSEDDTSFDPRTALPSSPLFDSKPVPIPVPDPSTPTETTLRLRVVPQTIDLLSRIFAILRAKYGNDKPDWWCLEILFLHVQAGWTQEDADFRRRTAEFATLARDGFQCQNPLCTARRNLTVHHIVFRSHGGSDDPDNKITLCAACHLQGVHTVGSIRVNGTAPRNLKWSFGRAAT